MVAGLLLGRVRVAALWPPVMAMADCGRPHCGGSTLYCYPGTDGLVVYSGGPYAPWKPHVRNRWMVDRPGLVVPEGRMC